MLYSAGIHIYQGLLKIAALKNRKAARMLAGRKEALSRLRQALGSPEYLGEHPEARPVWVHAASLGEFEQGRPLMERIRREHPGVKIVLSFYSPSGYEVRKNWEGADAVVYLPGDTPQAMRRFLEAVHPRMAVIVKYEFWGNMLRQLQQMGVPTYLISGIFRPDQKFFKSGPMSGTFRKMLGRFTHLFVQDERSRRLLRGIGIKDVTVAGDTRFDRVTDIMRTTRSIPELDRFTRGGTRLTLMVGSSWGPDEAVYFPWLKRNPDSLLAVIAPHEFDAARLEKMKAQLAPEVKAVLLSEARERPELLDTANCLIIDCFGLLSSAYRYANIAYVGGGFGVGIHNINEAAVYSIPVIFGPNHSKFLEAGDLIRAKGGFEVRNEADFRKIMEKKLLKTPLRKEAGEAAGTYIKNKLGATDLIYKQLQELLTF